MKENNQFSNTYEKLSFLSQYLDQGISEDGFQSRTVTRFDLIPPLGKFKVAGILAEGAKKYGENNWKKIPVDQHLNHAFQHMTAHLANDDFEPHIAHAICRLMFALELIIEEGNNDHYL